MSCFESCAKFFETLDAVINDREEVIVTRTGADPVVFVPLHHYRSLQETVQLLRGPEKARRLLASIDRLERGRADE